VDSGKKGNRGRRVLPFTCSWSLCISSPYQDTSASRPRISS
jgi:hypothetical protein